MALVNGNEIFNKAREGKYAVGAFNTNNLEWTRAILGAAQETNTPILIQTSVLNYYLGQELTLSKNKNA